MRFAGMFIASNAVKSHSPSGVSSATVGSPPRRHAHGDQILEAPLV
ncbi:hypothetical protein OG589_10930 [Sphaerisporangium sp. NBC_01403]